MYEMTPDQSHELARLKNQLQNITHDLTAMNLVINTESVNPDLRIWIFKQAILRYG
jgi:cytidylate kinase